MEKLKFLSEISEYLAKIFAVFATIFGTLGFIIVSVYCISISYYPHGLSVGDLAFLFLALIAFVIVHGIFLGMGWVCSIWLFWLMTISRKLYKVVGRNTDNDKEITFGISEIVLSIFLTTAFFSIYLLQTLVLNPRAAAPAGNLLLGYWMAGFVICVGVATIPKATSDGSTAPSGPLWIRAAIIGFAALFPLLGPGNGILPVRGAMSFLGVRAERVDIRVNQSDFEKIQDAISSREFAISDCSARQAASHLIYGVNILWNRVGDFAYVEVPNAVNTQGVGARFEVKSEDIVVLKSTSLPCYRLRADALFGTKQSTIEPERIKLLDPLVADIRRRGTLASARVTGYADPRASDKPDNTTLSRNRAEAIKTWLLENFEINPTQIETLGLGDQHSLVDCSKAKNVDECNAPNRRVDLVVSVTRDEKVDLGRFGNWLRQIVIAALMRLSS